VEGTSPFEPGQGGEPYQPTVPPAPDAELGKHGWLRGGQGPELGGRRFEVWFRSAPGDRCWLRFAGRSGAHLVHVVL